jgi:hypothetical protein
LSRGCISFEGQVQAKQVAQAIGPGKIQIKVQMASKWSITKKGNTVGSKLGDGVDCANMKLIMPPPALPLFWPRATPFVGS